MSIFKDFNFSRIFIPIVVIMATSAGMVHARDVVLKYDQDIFAIVQTSLAGDGFLVRESDDVQIGSGLTLSIEPIEGTKCYVLIDHGPPEIWDDRPCTEIRIVDTDDD